MTRLDATGLRRPMSATDRYRIHGPVQGSHTPYRAWRIAAAVVVGVGAGFAGWWL